MKYLSEQLSSYDRYLALEAFSEGRNFDAFKLFGSHPHTQDGEIGYRFMVWAPKATLVCLSGDFNQWNTHSHPMKSLEGGIWEIFIPRLQRYDAYKYSIHTQDGRVLSKADPYGFHSETRPGTATKIYTLEDYQWHDEGWQEAQKRHDPYTSPMNIYELHLGSWRRGGSGEFLDYRTISSLLVSYVKEMGYTHVELMPVMEHPLDDSWGYQVTGYFAATSRFGTPDDLKYLIDQLHMAGVGVILDWVPAHFPRDAFGLYQFDGTPTYEYQDPRKGEHPQWGTNCFDLGRNEVKSFLFSSAMFWLEEFHADGLRVDAVSSMLYLSFGREDGEWMPNVEGGEENLEAIDFLRQMNTEIFKRFPHALMVAEEATSWPQVTHPVSEGGLGFNFKWNMGWMNDICHYIDLDPLARQHHHKDLTFSMMYAFNENYVLPMSHDEVVHEKSSFVGKMAGDTFQKLSASRGFQLYILTHPGKKLTFMGQEFAQWNEWNFHHSLDWHLMDFDDHKKMKYFHQKANELYLNSPALWERDRTWDGFLWLCADDNLGNTLSYARMGEDGNPLVVVCNFSPVHRNGYRVALPKSGIWEETLNSDWQEFGGANHRNDGELYSEMVDCYGQPQSMEINLPPNATVVFSYSKKNFEKVMVTFDPKIHKLPDGDTANVVTKDKNNNIISLESRFPKKRDTKRTSVDHVIPISSENLNKITEIGSILTSPKSTPESSPESGKETPISSTTQSPSASETYPTKRIYRKMRDRFPDEPLRPIMRSGRKPLSSDMASDSEEKKGEKSSTAKKSDGNGLTEKKSTGKKSVTIKSAEPSVAEKTTTKKTLSEKAPTKKKRGKTTEERGAKETVSASEDAPKKVSRKKKDSPSETAQTTETPKRRGRPPKVNASGEESVEKPKRKTRGKKPD